MNEEHFKTPVNRLEMLRYFLNLRGLILNQHRMVQAIRAGDATELAAAIAAFNGLWDASERDIDFLLQRSPADE